MDQVARFAAELPAWTGPEGLPASWYHFAYGSRYLNRRRMRAILDTGAGVRGGMATEESYADWRSDLEVKA